MRHLYITLLALFFSLSFPKAYGQVGAINGNPGMCSPSYTTSLSDTTTGGIWTISTSVATIGTDGTVTGLTPGTATVTYTVGAYYATLEVTVNPTTPAITGGLTVCSGLSITLGDGSAGGTWSSSNTVLATIGETTGVVTTAYTSVTDTTTITYTLGTGCTTTAVVTVDPDPGPIEGSLTVCVGLTTALTDAASGGTWTDGCLAGVATVGSFGVVEGISAGTCVITYALVTGCIATAVVTVVATAPAPMGPTSVCVGNTFTLSDAITPGTWSSSNTAIVSVGSASGILYANSAGTVTLTYDVFTGCITVVVVTVNPTPSGITGLTDICSGYCTTLNDATPGGTWSGSNAIATVGSTTGITCGVAAGTIIITYKVGTVCMTTTVVTVNPPVYSISGSASACVGSIFSLTDITTGGTWSSSNTVVASVGLTGIVTAASTGTATITYALSSGSGCSATIIVTVNPNPGPIEGSTPVCVGSGIGLSDSTAGGSWSNTCTSIAEIGLTTGIVEGISEGTCVFTYTLGTGCISTTVVTVNPLPSVISGSPSVCVGGTDTLSGFTGGTWSGGGGAATISAGDVISGISVGSGTFTYTATTGCFETFLVTVTATVATISGPTALCVGSPITLTDATAGGAWSSSATAIASISGSSGIVTGATGGTATITYQLSSGCYSALEVTVNAAPSVSVSATPGDTVCTGTSANYSVTTAGISITGYKWYVNGVLSGSSSTYSYIPATGDAVLCIVIGTSTCSGGPDTVTSNTVNMVVNALPTITATSTENCGGTYNLNGSGAGTGGTYSWEPVTGLSCYTCSAPTATVSVSVTYTLTGTDINSCANTHTVSVNGNRISGYMTMTTTPTDTLKVWLIQFNSSDSSLTAEDSTLTCMDGGTPYYEFDNEPTGNYMVKAMLLGSVPGTSGYIPTYGLSTPHWDTAAHVIHASATDTQHINMIYGTVPTGPGFIGGLISSGAGRGTSTPAPVPGMLVYLEDGSGNILTYTYTNTSGIYTFSDLALGAYRIYPEAYQYHTTPYISITLTASADSVTTADFIQNTTRHTITPGDNLSTPQIVTATKISIYPNPAINDVTINWQDEQTGNADVTITDITGREVLKSQLNISTPSGTAPVDIRGLNEGIYFISIKSNSLFYTNKLLIGQ